MYYPFSENKGADQLRGYREADLRLCFCICKKLFLTTRLIRRRGLGFKFHPTDWRRPGSSSSSSLFHKADSLITAPQRLLPLPTDYSIEDGNKLSYTVMKIRYIHVVYASSMGHLVYSFFCLFAHLILLSCIHLSDCWILQQSLCKSFYSRCNS